MKPFAVSKQFKWFISGAICSVLISYGMTLTVAGDRQTTNILNIAPKNHAIKDNKVANFIPDTSINTTTTSNINTTTKSNKPAEEPPEFKKIDSQHEIAPLATEKSQPPAERLILNAFQDIQRAESTAVYLKEVTGYEYKIDKNNVATSNRYQIKLIVPKDMNPEDMLSKISALTGIQLDTRAITPVKSNGGV